MPEDGVGTSNR